MAADLTAIFARVTQDFEYFCRVCLTIPARNYRVSPELSQIVSQPFILSEHQREFLKYLAQPHADKVILKTRQRGYSVFMLAWCLWRILYGQNENIIYAIDRLDKATEFRLTIQKLYDSIPDQFRPKGIEIRSSNKARNASRSNTLTIATATDNTGRSGTYTTVILDEFSYYDLNIQASIAAAVTSSCPTNRIWISTPKQEQDTYHKKVQAAESDGTIWRHEYYQYYLDWFGTEENARAWRREQEKGLTRAQIARELDCEFKGAVEDTVWVVEPQFFVKANPQIGDRVCVSLDLGYVDPTVALFAREYNQTLHVIDELVVKQSTIPTVCSLIKSKGYTVRWGACDSSGKKVDQSSGVSSHAELQRLLGCRFYTRKLPDKIELKNIAQTALLSGRVKIDQERCPYLVEMLHNYEWKENDTFRHDQYSHPHDAFVYLIYNWLRRPKRDNRPQLLDRSKLGIRF